MPKKAEWKQISREVVTSVEVMIKTSEAGGEIESRVANTCIATLIGMSHHEGCPEDYRVFVSNLEFTGKWEAPQIKAYNLLKQHSSPQVM